MGSKVKAIIALFVVQLLYGFNYTFAKTVMNENYIKPYGFVLLRVIGASILFWLLSLWLPKEKIEKKDFITIFYAAVFGVCVNMLLFLKGLEYTTPIHASTIMTITPIIVLVLSAIALKERITQFKILGVFIGCVGALILTLYGKSPRVADNILLGNSMIFFNASSYSIYIILLKKLTTKYHPFTLIKWLFLFGLIVVIPFGYQELSEVNWRSFTPYISFSVIYVVVGATFMTYLLNPWAISKLRATTVGIFIYFQPVIAGLFSVIYGTDFLDALKIIAITLIFLGVYFVTKKPTIS